MLPAAAHHARPDITAQITGHVPVPRQLPRKVQAVFPGLSPDSLRGVGHVTEAYARPPRYPNTAPLNAVILTLRRAWRSRSSLRWPSRRPRRAPPRTTGASCSSTPATTA